MVTEPIQAANLEKIRHRIGYVIQEGGLFPHLTVEQNVTLMAHHLNRPHDQTRETLTRLCRLTHLQTELLKRYPQELSGGQRQRVSLIRALMLDPEVLLLDEPLGALDPMVRASLQEELKSIFQDLGKTVIMVTHDMAEAGYFADSIVLLQKGRIVQQGTLDQLQNEPPEPFVRDFLNAQKGKVAL